MTLSGGSRLGPYEIVSLVGAGGMGEVYRARDTKLGREVAVKVLPEAFAFDPERVARFEREAKVLASLNHRHIAGLHGMEEADGRHFLIMEFVEGETLAERLQRGALLVEQALTLAIQIADALEAAHEKGVVHRDLKPANIKITPDEQIKVLDFGLARAGEPAGATAPRAGAIAATHSPTLSLMATQAGMILGTAAYMSPEQAKGAPADHRSDVFAFGCVLYEMLTGRQAFHGDSAPEILASVLAREPDFTILPANLNPRLVDLVRRCFEKMPRRRWQAAGDLRMELEALAAAPRGAADVASLPPVGAGRPVRTWRHVALVGAPAVVTAALAGGGVWFAMRPEPPRVSRLAITTTPATALSINGVDRDLAITPDGSRLIYTGNNGTDLFVRPLDGLEPTSLFKGSPRGPFVSPDGQWVGFFDGVSVLKKVAITGGPPVTIGGVDSVSRGATWTPDDTIVFATNSTATGLQEVAAVGGPVTALTRVNRAGGELDHMWPELLPGGRAVLFTIYPVGGGVEAAQVAVFDRQTSTHKVLIRGGSHAHYVRSGHLVYAAANTLRAVAFDPVMLETRGTPVLVAGEVVTTGPLGGGTDAVMAANGTLAYVRGAGASAGPRTLVWVDRLGRETPIATPPRAYIYPRIGPEGGRVVAWSNDQESDLWLWDFARLTLTRLTFTPGQELYPVWTPDGRRLIFASDREGTINLFSQAADGTGAMERLTRSPNVQFPTAVSPDATRVIFTETTAATSDDVMQVELAGTRMVTPLVQSPFVDRNGIISPDGRWLAYEASDSGSLEIYVRPYPDVNSGRWQVSTGGGTRPLWSRTGQELFYVSPAGAILRVGVERGASWAATAPVTVIKQGYAAALGGFVGRTYDVSSDGQRFLVLKPPGDPAASPPQLIVVQHFDEELKSRVPVP